MKTLKFLFIVGLVACLTLAEGKRRLEEEEAFSPSSDELKDIDEEELRRKSDASNNLPVAPAYPHPIPQFVIDQINAASQSDAKELKAHQDEYDEEVLKSLHQKSDARPSGRRRRRSPYIPIAPEFPHPIPQDEPGKLNTRKHKIENDEEEKLKDLIKSEVRHVLSDMAEREHAEKAMKEAEDEKEIDQNNNEVEDEDEFDEDLQVKQHDVKEESKDAKPFWGRRRRRRRRRRTATETNTRFLGKK